MLELLVSNIPGVGHPPVTEGGGVRFWLRPELGDASWPPVSESELKAAAAVAVAAACCCFLLLVTTSTGQSFVLIEMLRPTITPILTVM